MKKLTQEEAKALDYLRRIGSVWVITASDDFLALLNKLHSKGYVEFRPRPNGGGSDAFPV